MDKIILSRQHDLFRDSFNRSIREDLFGHFIKAHIFDPTEAYFKSNVKDHFYKTDDIMLFGALDLPLIVGSIADKFKKINENVPDEFIQKHQFAVVKNLLNVVDKRVSGLENISPDFLSRDRFISLISLLPQHLEESKYRNHKDELLDQLHANTFRYPELSQTGKSLSFLLKLGAVMQYWKDNFQFDDKIKVLINKSFEKVSNKIENICNEAKNSDLILGAKLEDILHQYSIAGEKSLLKAVDAYAQAALHPDSKSYEKEAVLLLHKLMHS